jgi:hypothetical protein
MTSDMQSCEVFQISYVSFKSGYIKKVTRILTDTNILTNQIQKTKNTVIIIIIIIFGNPGPVKLNCLSHRKKTNSSTSTRVQAGKHGGVWDEVQKQDIRSEVLPSSLL